MNADVKRTLDPICVGLRQKSSRLVLGANDGWQGSAVIPGSSIRAANCELLEIFPG